ncbi:MAG: helix-turn-helix transcriptional regulator [Candidatus Methanofastidiosia archaeon]
MKFSEPRLEILKILRKRSSSVDELCEKLKITPTAARQHLILLERDHLVKKGVVKEGMGRPKYIYSITEKAQEFFPKRYDLLTELLIEEILREKGNEKLNHLIDSISERIYQESRRDFEGKDLKERVSLLCELLNERGAEAVLYEIEKAYEFEILNCPFYLLARKYPSLCRLDLNLFEKLCERRIERKKSIATGDSFCLFSIVKEIDF